MALATATITYDLANLVGLPHYKGTSVTATTNIPGDTVVDTDGNKIRLGSGRGTIDANGKGSVVVWVPGTGSNPASWQTYLHVRYRDPRAHGGATERTFGPFTITGNADLADLVAEQDVPPNYTTGVLAEMTALRDETALISGLTGEDAAVAALVNSSSSDTKAALSATFVARTGTKTDGSTGLVDLEHNGSAGYLFHLTTGAASAVNTAAIGIGTDEGSAYGILISHKNSGAGVGITSQPGAGFAQYLIGYSSNPVTYTDIYTGSGGEAVRLRTGQAFANGVTTAGSNVLTSATAAFTAGDVGQSVSQLTSRGSGDPLGTIPNGTTIVSVTNSTTAVMSANATATTTGLMFRLGGRAPAWNQAIHTVYDSDGTTVLGLINQAGLDWRAGQIDRPAVKVRGKAGMTGNILEVINSASTIALNVSENGVGGTMSASFHNQNKTTRNALMVTNYSTTASTLYIIGAAGQTGNQLVMFASDGTTMQSRFDKNGHFMTRKTAAPADSDIAAGEMALWFDSTNGAAKLMVKAKQADGTVRTGSVALA